MHVTKLGIKLFPEGYFAGLKGFFEGFFNMRPALNYAFRGTKDVCLAIILGTQEKWRYCKESRFFYVVSFVGLVITILILISFALLF